MTPKTTSQAAPLLKNGSMTTILLGHDQPFLKGQKETPGTRFFPVVYFSRGTLPTTNVVRKGTTGGASRSTQTLRAACGCNGTSMDPQNGGLSPVLVGFPVKTNKNGNQLKKREPNGGSLILPVDIPNKPI